MTITNDYKTNNRIIKQMKETMNYNKLYFLLPFDSWFKLWTWITISNNAQSFIVEFIHSFEIGIENIFENDEHDLHNNKYTEKENNTKERRWENKQNKQ